MRIIVQPCTAGVRQFEQRKSVKGDPPSAICSGGMHAVEVRDILRATWNQTHLRQLFRRCGHSLRKKAGNCRGPAMQIACADGSIASVALLHQLHHDVSQSL